MLFLVIRLLREGEVRDEDGTGDYVLLQHASPISAQVEVRLIHSSALYLQLIVNRLRRVS